MSLRSQSWRRESLRRHLAVGEEDSEVRALRQAISHQPRRPFPFEEEHFKSTLAVERGLWSPHELRKSFEIEEGHVVRGESSSQRIRSRLPRST